MIINTRILNWGQRAIIKFTQKHVTVNLWKGYLKEKVTDGKWFAKTFIFW